MRKEKGDTSLALHPVWGKVEVTYVERDLEWSDPPGIIPDVLVGVYLLEDKILVIPAQATPKIKAWREAKLRELGIEDTLAPRLKKMREDLSSRLSRYADEGRLDEDGCVIYPEDSNEKEDHDEE